MAHRADPARIDAAHEGVRRWLIATHMTPDTADRWLDAWILEATGRGLPKDGAYWQAGWD